MPAKAKEPTFEEALKSLENVVAKLESGETNLEESIRLFEEGMRLSALCQKRLDDADKKIESLLRKPGGGVTGTENEADVLRDEEGRAGDRGAPRPARGSPPRLPQGVRRGRGHPGGRRPSHRGVPGHGGIPPGRERPVEGGPGFGAFGARGRGFRGGGGAA